MPRATSGYHHHIGLNTWESKGGLPPPRGTAGLYHTAFNVPTRWELAQLLKRITDTSGLINNYGTPRSIVSYIRHMEES